jgi:hypothetical protein
MAYYRKLPSGLWQATVRGRDGKRHTKTDKLKTVVKQWATEQEAAIARGEFGDPRPGDIKVGDWRRRVAAARATDPVTKAKHALNREKSSIRHAAQATLLGFGFFLGLKTLSQTWQRLNPAA